MTTTSTTAPAQRQRDLRLDFFRGLAMFIILLAHTPGNSWTLWIPARFGFSDATEIFVFCSGMATGIAFGSVFVKKSWFLGGARISYRVWQVYWAHIGVFFVTALLMVVIDQTGLGAPHNTYVRWFPVAQLFTDTAGTLAGLFTLTYIPGLFDILPMYLVILAMVPVVMAIFRAGGREAVFAFIAVVWLCSNLAGYAQTMEGTEDMSAFQSAAAWLGGHLTWMNLPAMLFADNVELAERATWFFNPFGWQLVFFTGFCFAMGWIPQPPVTRRLVVAAIAVVVLALPLAWHKMYEFLTGYVPAELGGEFFWEARDFTQPLWWKTWVGIWRYLHFLAVAYLAWASVGPGGVRLTTGWGVVSRTDVQRFTVRWAAAVMLLLTAPYTYISEIKVLAPALDRWFFENIPLVDGRYLGTLHLVHLAALIVFLWHSIGDGARRWLLQDAFLRTVPVIRKVGTQSLAVFLVSIVMSQFSGAWMDGIDAWLAAHDWTYMTERDVWVRAMVNLTGFAVLILTAYVVGWFRRQPWRDRATARVSAAHHDGARQPVPAE